jgi:hypothetical protein
LTGTVEYSAGQISFGPVFVNLIFESLFLIHKTVYVGLDESLERTTAGGLDGAPGVGGIGAFTLLPMMSRMVTITTLKAPSTIARITRLFNDSASHPLQIQFLHRMKRNQCWGRLS